MIISDTTLKKYLKSKKIQIKPEPRDEDFKSVGIRLTLDGEILIPEQGQVVDVKNQKTDLKFKKVKISEKGYIMKPGAFILGAIEQRYKASRGIAGFIDGRSTLARLGLSIHQTSMVVEGNNDHFGSITLEISNQGPFKIVLHKGMQIGMLVFVKLTEPVGKKQNFNYQKQMSVLPPDLKALKK